MHARPFAYVEPGRNVSLARYAGADCRTLNRELQSNVLLGTDERAMLCDHRKGQLSHGQTGADGIAASGGEDGRLAEAARRGQRRDGPAGRCAACRELRAVAVAVGFRRDGHALLEQPGHRGWGAFGRSRGGQAPLRGGGPQRWRRTCARVRATGAPSGAGRAGTEPAGTSHVQ